MKKLIISAIAGAALLLNAAPAFATRYETPPVEKCGAETVYTKEGDFDNSKVNINFQDSDEAITVTAKAGYAIAKVELNVDDDNHAGFFTYALISGVKFNPNPGDDIQVAKVTVAKICTPVCTDKEANNVGEVVEGQTVGDNTVCTYDEPVPPVATPSATPTTKPVELPNTGAEVWLWGLVAIVLVGGGIALYQAKKKD